MSSGDSPRVEGSSPVRGKFFAEFFFSNTILASMPELSIYGNLKSCKKMSKFESLCVNALDLILIVHEMRAVHVKVLVNGGGLYIGSYGEGVCAVADLGGAAPLRPKIFSISCSFSENLTKSYVGAPPRGSAPPPTGNPGSAPGVVLVKSNLHRSNIPFTMSGRGVLFLST